MRTRRQMIPLDVAIYEQIRLYCFMSGITIKDFAENALKTALTKALREVKPRKNKGAERSKEIVIRIDLGGLKGVTGK